MEMGNVKTMDGKLGAHVEATSVNSPDFTYEDGLQPQKGSTQADVLDMSRMGKRQELQVGPNICLGRIAKADYMRSVTSDSCPSWASS